MIRGDARSPSEALVDHLAGAALARLGDLWLVAGDSGLVLLEVSAGEPTERHRRVGEAADLLRRALFELLTVAPFIEPLVVVPDDAPPGPAEVPADLVRHLVGGSGPIDPVVARVRQLVDAGLLPRPWRRHRQAPMAG